LSGSCKERLDQLNQGHEQAREELGLARKELAAIQNSITKETGVLLPSDPHHREISEAEMALREAESMIAADPIGAQELTHRAVRSLDSLAEPAVRGSGWHHNGPVSFPVIEELAAAAKRFRATAASLRVTDLIGLFVRGWVLVWVLGLLFGLLTSLMPLFILLIGFLIMAAGGLAVLRGIVSWLAYGVGRHGR
jgi:hypothetical protein